MKSSYIKKLFVSAALLGATALAHADVVVVVASGSPVSSLTADQVAQLFTGKADTFPGGGKAVPIDQAEGSADRNAFHAKVTGKDAAQLKAYWSKLIFAGKGQPPKEVASGADVKKAVAADPAAIGYLDKSLVDGSIKVVLAP